MAYARSATGRRKIGESMSNLSRWPEVEKKSQGGEHLGPGLTTNAIFPFAFVKIIDPSLGLMLFSSVPLSNSIDSVLDP